jgi:ubiquinone/menaquinone biosynthesis C-methylase UbiE
VTELVLLPEHALVRTSDLDQAAWNYRRGPLGRIMRSRYALATELLGAGHDSLLEIGYGSGIFLPTLAQLTEHLSGVDVHNDTVAVTEALAAAHVVADLATAPAEHLPYDEGAFDAVVAVSTLEFVDDIDAALAEVERVLRPDGIAVFITPRASKVLDLGLRVLTGERAEDTFKGRRQGVLPAISRRFVVDRSRRLPPIPGMWLYTGVRVRRWPRT